MGAVGNGDGDPHGFAESDLQIGRKHCSCDQIISTLPFSRCGFAALFRGYAYVCAILILLRDRELAGMGVMGYSEFKLKMVRHVWRY